MINPSELRIGNSIQGGNVTHLKPNLIVLDKKVDDQKQLAIRPEFAKPIPLTDEVIESYGYHDVGKVKVFCYDFKTEYGFVNEYDLESGLRDGIYTFTANRRMQRDIKYLHELQNIHYALTGQELKLLTICSQ